MVELPTDIINHINSFIPKDRHMKSPVADLLKVEKYEGRYTVGPSKYKFFYDRLYYGRRYISSFRVSSHTLKESNNFWQSRSWILCSLYKDNDIPFNSNAINDIMVSIIKIKIQTYYKQVK